MRVRRHRRIRAKISGTASKPRLAVFRSHNHVYAQLIDDEAHKTIISCSDMKLTNKIKSPLERAAEVGKLAAGLALKKGIQSAVFDRGGFAYHGQVKAVAEGARSAGLKL